MLKKTLSGVCAGLLITIGGSVFLACENRYAGSVLFSVALLVICLKGYALFTGKVGFMTEKHDREAWRVLGTALLGNLIGTVIGGLLIRYAVPNLGAAAEALAAGKLAQAAPQTFIRACFCGMLMYLAVSVYRDRAGNITAILFCIPVFILSGFEHSIADMFYFACGGMFTVRTLAFICVAALGNALGGMLLPILSSAGKERQA